MHDIAIGLKIRQTIATERAQKIPQIGACIVKNEPLRYTIMKKTAILSTDNYSDHKVGKLFNHSQIFVLQNFILLISFPNKNAKHLHIKQLSFSSR